MLFTSISFIIFLFILFPIYFIFPNKYKWVLLLIFSYIYYSFANPKFLIFLFISTISTYLFGICIYKLNLKEDELLKNNSILKQNYQKIISFKRNLYLTLTLVINLGMIFCFKQISLINDNLNLSNILNIALPLGMSYYVLQSIGYTIDIYRKIVKPEFNVAKYALFVSYFPQFLMGPISRFNDLHYQFFEKYKFNKYIFISGIQRLLWGFFKKLVIADRIGIFVNMVYSNYNEYSGITLIIAMLLYSFQIYADFSSYMDIAIGVSNCIGINIQENFKSPYFSKSAQEFWTRWHITLYTWFRDYIFYPILRSKYIMKLSSYLKKKSFILSSIPVMISILIVWFLTGIWHGHQWHYIVASLYHGVLIICCIFIQKYKIFKNVNVYIKIIVTFMLISFGHFIFKISSLLDVGNIVSRIIHYPILNNISLELNTNIFSTYEWCITIFGIIILLFVDYAKLKNKLDLLNTKINFVIIYTLLLFIVIFGKFGETTFIYLGF